LGAEHGVNDGDAEFARAVRNHTAKRGVDVAVDCSGGSGWVNSLACLARGGCLVTTDAITDAKPLTDLRRIFWNHLRIFGANLGSRADFQQVLHFTETTRMRPIVDQVFALKDAAWAHQRWEQGAGFGKIVLDTQRGFSITSRLD
jgi:NADPH2:quinone reductase